MSRHSARPSADLFDELIVDSFAGGGGASMGIEDALGRAVDVAINHDAAAIEMHSANHPHTLHLTEDVWKVDPLIATGGRPVGLLWASPDCKHHSRAKGSKPVDKRIRSLAWVVVKWAQIGRPRVIILENVAEFEDWGPVIPKMNERGIRTIDKVTGRPIFIPNPKKKGQTFRRWVSCLRREGYVVEWKRLNAADFGAPTNRKRLFLIARCDGKAIVWPEKTHGKCTVRGGRGPAPGSSGGAAGVEVQGRLWVGEREESGRRGQHVPRQGTEAPEQAHAGAVAGTGLLPHHTAAECIDFERPSASIFLSADEARALKKSSGIECKRPLAAKTMRRIAVGIKKFVLDKQEPFVVNVQHGGDWFRGQSLHEPLGAITAKHGYGLVTPLLAECANSNWSAGSRPVDVPMATVTANPKGGAWSLVSPLFVGAGGSGYAGKPRECDRPFGVVKCDNHQALASVWLAKHYGGVIGTAVDQPLGTVTAVDHHSLIVAHLAKFRGESKGSAADEPMPTITSGAGSARPAGAAHALGLVGAFLTKFYGTNIGVDAREPLPTSTAGGNHVGAVTAFLIRYFGTGCGQGVQEPKNTTTCRDRDGLVTCDLGGFLLNPAQLSRAKQVAEWLKKELGEGVEKNLLRVLDEDGSTFDVVFVCVRGEVHLMTDVFLRMLTPRELARAQGFPNDYILTGSNANQVARVGNSVCPVMARVLVAANCIDMAAPRYRSRRRAKVAA